MNNDKLSVDCSKLYFFFIKSPHGWVVIMMNFDKSDPSLGIRLPLSRSIFSNSVAWRMSQEIFTSIRILEMSNCHMVVVISRGTFHWSYSYLFRVSKSQHRSVRDFWWRVPFFYGRPLFQQFYLHGPLWRVCDMHEFTFIGLLVSPLVEASRVFEEDFPLGDSSISHLPPMTYLINWPFFISTSLESVSWM